VISYLYSVAINILATMAAMHVGDNINIARLLSKSRTSILTGCSKLEVSMYTAVNKVEGVLDLIEARIQVHEAKEQNWAEVLARVQTYSVRATEKIKLDIGGRIFAASKSLLVSFEDSFFSALLSSGRWPPGRDGCYFVDRTPTVYFATMLHFMRTGQFEIQHFTKTQRSLLEEEFDFFQIPLPISFLMYTCVGRLVHTMCLEKHDINPYKMAVSMNGEVFITDHNKHCIDVFTKDGYLLRSWGQLGQENGDFNYPAGIAISVNNEVFVADRANHRVQVFDLDGNFLRKWGLSGTQDEYFSNPTNITVSADGEVFVIHNGGTSLQVFCLNGIFIRAWSCATVGYADGLAVSTKGLVFVVDSGKNCVYVFDRFGVFVRRWGSEGTAAGQFYSPDSLAVSCLGEIFIGDSGNKRIQVFGEDGVFRRQFSGFNAMLDEYEYTNDFTFSGIAVTPTGCLLVLLSETCSVYRFE
jgi:DNA-binding beta-propeller fold protein YncE